MTLKKLFAGSNPDDILRLLTSAFEDAIDGVIIICERGRIEAVNSAAATLFGYNPEDIIKQNINVLMPEPYQKEHDGYISGYLSTGQKKIIGIGREVKGKRKDGSIFPFRLSVSEAWVEDRRLFTGFIHDVSDLKKAQEQLSEFNAKLEQIVDERTEELYQVVNKLLSTNKQLEREVEIRETAESRLLIREQELRTAYEKERVLGELKTRFVSMASHEFRTPLSAILSSAQLLSRYVTTEQQDKREKHIRRIKSAVANLNGILNDFLSLSKLEEGKVDVNPKHFFWNSFCQEVYDELEGLLKDNQTFHHQFLPDDQEVYLDERILKNIFYNLVSNAIKYSEENTTIFCRSRIENEKLYFEIQDEGMGIPIADQQYLFTRFFRAANVINIQGTGLGLTIVKSYVDLLGGKIHFESIEQVGTTFFVELPLVYESELQLTQDDAAIK